MRRSGKYSKERKMVRKYFRITPHTVTDIFPKDLGIGGAAEGIRFLGSGI